MSISRRALLTQGGSAAVVLATSASAHLIGREAEAASVEDFGALK